jgi:16S rRNA (cytosine1402-N4)-methyltransferase
MPVRPVGVQRGAGDRAAGRPGRLSVSGEAQGHEPVLVDEVLRLLEPAPGQIILDGTVGLGGHAIAIIPRLLPGGTYIGLDVDEQMLVQARERLGALDQAEVQIVLERANYAEIGEVLDRVGVPRVDALLLDLGANSAQIDEAERGFSFDRDGPLDMRFDRSQRRTATELVNSLSERELADLIYRYSQEPLSRKIARRICQLRRGARLNSTKALAAAVQSAYASAGRRRGRTHPATRVFQALRIAVNDELGNLERFTERALEHLRPDGRIAVISFHSLEDGIVKRFMRRQKAAGRLRELTKRPVVPDSKEQRRNPRSRSAKLRVAQRVEAS